MFLSTCRFEVLYEILFLRYEWSLEMNFVVETGLQLREEGEEGLEGKGENG